MQIGKGKQGVIVSEYGDDGSGFLGYIEPACDKNQWIMWFDSKGDAVLYTERETGLEPKYHQEGCPYRKGPDFPCTCGGPAVKRGGAVLGDPIRIKAEGRTRKTTGAPQASITGNMELGRIKINGEDLVKKVKELIKEGNIRRITVKNEAGESLVEFPLTFGVVGAALAPLLAAAGAVAALVTNCTIVVERRNKAP